MGFQLSLKLLSYEAYRSDEDVISEGEKIGHSLLYAWGCLAPHVTLCYTFTTRSQVLMPISRKKLKTL